MKKILLLAIRGYQFLLSPWLGNQCRFSPTCSAYAQQAVERHGALKGSFLSIRRVCKCHPYYKGDCIDPVP